MTNKERFEIMKTRTIWTAHTVRGNPMDVFDFRVDDFVTCKTEEERNAIIENNKQIQAQYPRTKYTQAQIAEMRKILSLKP